MAGEITEIARIKGKDIRDKKLADKTEVQQASGLPSVGNLKFILENGTDGEFQAALDSIIVDRIRELFGAKLNNLDKGTSVDLIPVIQKSGTSPDFSFDLGSTTPANLASVLSAALLSIGNGYITDPDSFTIANGVCGVYNHSEFTGVLINFSFNEQNLYQIIIKGGWADNSVSFVGVRKKTTTWGSWMQL